MKTDLAPDRFTEEELEGLPDPVVRYFLAAIAPGTRLASSTRLEMKGSIKLGNRWLPFHSHQVLAPHGDSIWKARVAGIMSGYDRYVAGEGSMRWKLLGLVPLMRADGLDVSWSAAGRFGGEAMWLPTTLLPRYGVTWTSDCANLIAAHFVKDDIDLDCEFEIDGSGVVRSTHFDRWGDPDNTGTHSKHPFGVHVTGTRTFDGLTIPSEGRAGWDFGTDRWNEFFRYEITSLEPVA